MKVLHLASGTDYGGGKTHIFTLLFELAKRIEVTLGSFSGGPFAAEARDLGLDVRTLGQTTRYDLRAVGRLAALVREGSYDIVHCHGPRANVLAAMGRRRLRRPLVTTVHSDFRRDFAGEPLKNFVFSRLNAAALRRFDRYLVGLGVEDSVLSLGIPREFIHPIRNGIDFENRPPAPSRTAVLARFGLPVPPEAVIVGIIARLHPVKGHEVFLEGAAAVSRLGRDAHFLVVGDGLERGPLEGLVGKLGLAGRVHFLGHLENPEDVIAVLDVNTLTSFSETLPYALLEGARWAVATVSSRVGGVPELIIDGVTGRLFEPGDVGEFARCLGELVADPGKRRELGRNLYDHARRNFTPAAMADTCLEVYQELLAKQPAGRGRGGQSR